MLLKVHGLSSKKRRYLSMVLPRYVGAKYRHCWKQSANQQLREIPWTAQTSLLILTIWTICSQWFQEKKNYQSTLIDVLSLFCHSSKSMANHFSLLLLQVTTILSHSYPTKHSPLQIIAFSLNQLMHAA